MKKIIALFIMLLGFGLTASAQQKAAGAEPVKKEADINKEKFRNLAREDVKALGEIVGFTGTQEADFLRLFASKHRAYAEGLSEERKNSVANSVEMKIRATLTAEQNEKLARHPEVLKKIVK